MRIKDFVYGKHKYRYYLIRENRKSIGLTVKPDLSLIVKAPVKASLKQIDNFLKKKWLWLEKQLAYFNKFQKKLYKKEYISGEGYLYLGRLYTLRIKRQKTESVAFDKGVINIFTSKNPSNSFYNKKLLESWYSDRINKIFPARYKKVLKQFNYKNPPKLETRKMSKRWGSFLTGKKIYLNPELIKASTDCIDYVIAHELCHMKHKDHSRSFYRLLKTKIPDWEKRKEKLELRLGWQIKM